MSESASEKRHAPTERRLRHAAAQGNVRRSADLPRAAILIAALLFAFTAASGLCAHLFDDCTAWLATAGTARPAAAQGWLDETMLLFGPFLFLIAAISILASLATGGWVFNPALLAPDFSKLMPGNGFSQIFSLHGLTETGKALLKTAVIFSMGAVMIMTRKSDFSGLAAAEFPYPAQLAGRCLELFAGIAFAVALLACADAGLQYVLHRRALRMSDSEMREEMKEATGNPHVRSQQRRLARKLARARQMKRIPEASVIITNPTHFAVAIRYRKGTDRAPLLLAKGAGLLAAEIVSRGKALGVPVVQAPPLARAMYRYVEPDEHIPVALYRACAEILAYVWKLQRWRAHGGAKPVPPQMPDEDIVIYSPGET